MIEGSEELKAYWYEASQFKRVDTEMEEAGDYHAVYMKTAEWEDYHLTHGGPYYVEVGKNIEIKYHTRMNVTKTKTSVGSNDTNSTNTTTTVSYIEEEDVIKSWTYYDYEPSSVEYYYY